jgi:hypothetical protein
MKKYLKTPSSGLLLGVMAFASAPQGTTKGTQERGRLESVLDADDSFLKQMPNLVWAHDPFERVPGYGVKPSGDSLPRLEAVFYSNTNPTAMLNGDEYAVGELIGEHRIAEIGRNYVLLEKGQSLVELVIAQEPDEMDGNIMIREHRVRTR